MFSFVSLGHKIRYILFLSFLIAALAVFLPLTTKAQKKDCIGGPSNTDCLSPAPTQTKPLPSPPLPQTASSTSSLSSPFPFFPSNFPSPEEFRKLSPEEQQKAILKLQADMEKDLENNPLKRCLALSSSLYDSVTFTLYLSQSSYQPGDTITFPGSIKNKNKEPIFNGAVFLRILREDKNFPQGNEIVSEAVLAKNLAIPGLSEISPSLSWQVPPMLRSGKYRANFYFSAGDGRFLVSGLPSVSQSAGHSLRFTIDGPSKSGMSWKSSSSKVNNTLYNQITGAAVTNNKPATISHTLTNKGLKPLSITVTEETFNTDSFQTDDPLDKQTKNITLLPNKEETITYQTPILSSPSYYIRFTAESPNESPAVINTILNVASSTSLRIRYAGLLNFPQVKDAKPVTAIACLANNEPSQEGNTLSLTLLNKDGKVLLTQSTTSPALSFNLPTNSSPDKIAFLAEVKNKMGQVTDSYQAAYDCSLLKGAPCPKENTIMANQTTSLKIFITLISLLALALVSFFGFHFIKKRYE